MADSKTFRTILDGREASAADLAPLAFAGFAHFSAMQVREGAVRGLDLHLARLHAASQEMFGRAHSDDELRARLRTALEGRPADVSLTVTVFSRAGEFTSAGMPNDPAVLVRTAPPSDGPGGPLRLATVEHERPLAAIKHVGEVAKTYYLRKAAAKGFDEAAFVDAQGRISEATIWNLVFWDGDTVVWPEAEMLAGITMQIVQRQLKTLGVAQRQRPVTRESVRRLAGAAVMNSWTPGVPVSALGAQTIPVSERFLGLLRRAYQLEPAVPV